MYVSKLILHKDVFVDTGGATLAVRINFIHFPPMEVLEYKRKYQQNTFSFDFEGGQTYHFSMNSKELAYKLKKIPLRIGVFRDGDTFPVCHVFTYLSGCACDMAASVVENPEPFVFRGPFDLVDPGNSFAGQLSAVITLTNFGKFLITSFALVPNSFLFKNDPQEDEYKCIFKDPGHTGGGFRPAFQKSILDIEHPMPVEETVVAENLVKYIAGISPVAKRLADGRPPPKPPRLPLVDPALAELDRRRGRRGRRGKGKGKGKKKRK